MHDPAMTGEEIEIGDFIGSILRVESPFLPQCAASLSSPVTTATRQSCQNLVIAPLQSLITDHQSLCRHRGGVGRVRGAGRVLGLGLGLVVGVGVGVNVGVAVGVGVPVGVTVGVGVAVAVGVGVGDDVGTSKAYTLLSPAT